MMWKQQQQRRRKKRRKRKEVQGTRRQYEREGQQVEAAEVEGWRRRLW